MSTDIFKFRRFANSAVGLEAGPIMPGDILALREHIQAIQYAVYNITDGGAPVTGSLVVDDVMFDAAQEWDRDDVGYTFLWEAPGTLFPLALKKYRVVVTYIQTVAIGGLSFIEVWENHTKSPTAP